MIGFEEDNIIAPTLAYCEVMDPSDTVNSRGEYGPEKPCTVNETLHYAKSKIAGRLFGYRMQRDTDPYIEVLDPRKPDEAIGIFLQMKEFFKNNLYCRTYRLMRGPYTKHEITTNMEPLFLELYFVHDKIPEMWNRVTVGRAIDLTSNDTFFYGPSMTLLSQSLFVSKNQSTEWIITYSAYVRQLMEPPYDTHCRDYQKDTPFQSSGHCYDHCLLTNSLDQFKVIPETVALRIPFDTSGVTFSTLRSRDMRATLNNTNPFPGVVGEDLYSNFTSLIEFCKQECRRVDCTWKYYAPRTMSTIDTSSKSRGNGRVAVALRAPNTALIKVYTDEKITMIDYMVYLCSTLSFWYGFSPATYGVDKRQRGDDCHDDRGESYRNVRKKIGQRRRGSGGGGGDTSFDLQAVISLKSSESTV